jgi:hypothetical protein
LAGLLRADADTAEASLAGRRCRLTATVGGETFRLGLAIAPAEFDLRLERSDESSVVWRTETFPPHWVCTSIHWDVEPRDEGTTVTFRHTGFTDDVEAGQVAYTWGQVMVKLKDYAERPARPSLHIALLVRLEPR